ncbi:imidazoleglycerol-phosphate dehydratase HisB [Candidatus Xianfuyuplasma coldseepsis]|uniref:Imidazoleglycerol-phosphate dehydratase n=2 Tax=Candidatus Xianfuyuplasma coldseepsis TaxID=2782163 RepID=A0A7L7KR74_9MOLU|nr:imidazoleglycerol-phosphate dehydratase HisB [Xianfuyuplasma coldseepsis]QMS84782.1 imidazoleglycerol-phosphate dehydratase HisB [Xianfuyuplasma coldseepsis]
MRTSSLSRQTTETDISIQLNLDGSNNTNISTGIPFFDHMLTALAFYANWDINLTAKGDLTIDDHHTVEDIGIVLGTVFRQALGSKTGITRFADTFTPMDEALVQVVIDISNRPYLAFISPFKREQIGGLSLENIKEFLYAFVMEARITLHINVSRGTNDHHIAEAIFKGLGRTLYQASVLSRDILPSTKGVLE